jgi:2-succinyl-5-enolpyruvyl-6-hydroxy-3-cyclohexene-1-carboxylate synthase
MEMHAPNRNTLWADIFVDELARGGLRAACIAPGSRSTALAVAFARHPEITAYSLLDERGAAFFALGLALATEQPAALVCTSGTAVANFYPAIVEANSAQVPLLVLTTDRPHELRHSGSNQTVDQVKIYGDQVRWFVDVALPEPHPLALRSLRTLAARALATTVGLAPGPVHLNFPFRKPLEPTPVMGDVPPQLHLDPARPAERPYTRLSRGILTPSADQLATLAELFRQKRRGLIICGPRSPGGDFPTAVTALATVTGYPLLADALSGVRFGAHLSAAEGTVISGYETFLQPQIVANWPEPEVILRIGAMPISKMLGMYLNANSKSEHIQLSDRGVWQDDTHTTTEFIWADPALTCSSLTDRLGQLPIDEGWQATWRKAEATTNQILVEAQTENDFEAAIVADMVALMPHSGTIFSASSLPVRHLDQFSGHNGRNLRIYANRGASGIDGTIATALGVAAAGDGGPLALVIGDLAFYHDLNSLLATRHCRTPLTIVLLNNNGGGIFHRLPIANFDPPFTDLFVTPHGLNFQPVADMFGVRYYRAGSRVEFRELFSRSIRQPAASAVPTIIEVPTDAVRNEAMRQQLMKRVAAALSD